MSTKRIMDPRKNVARSSTGYRNSWLSHIDELTSVFYEAGIPVDEWDALLYPLKHAVEVATLKLESHFEELNK